MLLETVKIKHESSKSGFAIINKSDLKEGDVLYGEETQAEAKEEAKGEQETKPTAKTQAKK